MCLYNADVSVATNSTILVLLNPELLWKLLHYDKTELEIEKHCYAFLHNNKILFR